MLRLILHKKVLGTPDNIVSGLEVCINRKLAADFGLADGYGQHAVGLAAQLKVVISTNGANGGLLCNQSE